MARSKRPANSQLYAPLIAFLASHAADEVTLSFTDIAEVIGWPLSVSAQVGTSYWTSRAFRDGLPARLRAIGWRARPDYPRRCVVFQRLPAEAQER